MAHASCGRQLRPEDGRVRMPSILQPPLIDSGRIARVHDALAGGIWADAAEREIAAEADARWPGTGDQVRAARVFHARVAAWAVTTQGTRAVIVGAAGYPCDPDPHREALAAVPEARFAFCDPDPVVTLANRAILGRDPRVTASHASVTDPAALLAWPWMGAPPGPLLAVLPLAAACWPGPCAAALLAEYGRLMPSGSLLAMSLWVPDGGRGGEEFLHWWRDRVSPAFGHSPEGVAGWLEEAGMEIMPPGVRDVRGYPGREWAEPHYLRRAPGRIVEAVAIVPWRAPRDGGPSPP
jgi:hypothetical protein